jgi:hypothetical protein
MKIEIVLSVLLFIISINHEVIQAKKSSGINQKSLMIIFDATASMGDDLAQLRAAAIDIINDFSSRTDNPIFNYVLAIYRDPGECFRLLIAKGNSHMMK